MKTRPFEVPATPDPTKFFLSPTTTPHREAIVAAGHVVVNQRDDAMVEYLGRIDALLLAPDWRGNSRSLMHVNSARSLNMPIFVSDSLGNLTAHFTDPERSPAMPVWSEQGPAGEEKEQVKHSTGGEKERGPDRYDLLPFDVLRQDALLYGIGARKYEARNWEKGYPWSLSLRAVFSHLIAWLEGESMDKDGFHHLTAVRFHAAALMRFEREFPELDDVRRRKGAGA
jgi:hypothetical protein